MVFEDCKSMPNGGQQCDVFLSQRNKKNELILKRFDPVDDALIEDEKEAGSNH